MGLKLRAFATHEPTDALVERFGTCQLLGAGGDSTAFCVLGPDGYSLQVLKVYNGLGDKSEASEQQLTDYLIDMGAVKKILEINPNPLDQEVQIDGISYELNYSIAQPGKRVDKETDDFFITVGDYVEGVHALVDATVSEEALIKVRNVCLSQLNGHFKKLTEGETLMLGMRMLKFLRYFNDDFTLSWDNVKITIDVDSKVLNVIVTDAVVALRDGYTPMEQFL